ncbi:MAG: Flagellar hook-length control protein FliK, partial [Myxococcaceae bacterium]|nr:Flagellar hook-length control protein FliK [Myxococcaceae bacterium]
MLLALAVAGCTSAGKPAVAPKLEAVVPAIAFSGEATLLRLSGEAFTPKATARWGGAAGDVTTQLGFEVFAGDRPLAQVTWVDSKTLTAVAPAGLPRGKHAVRVVDPYGVSTSLADALEIRARRGAVLTGTLTVPSSVVKQLEPIVAQLELTNVGDTPAEAIGALQLPASGTAGVTALGVSQGKPTLGPGESTRFALEWVSTRAGTVVLSGEARGVDSRSGKSVRAGPLTTGAIEILPIQGPARLTGALALPGLLAQSSQFTATLQVTNTGEALALAVTPSALAITGNATLVSGPTPASAPIAADAGVSFTWLLSAGTSGTVEVAASAAGTDANDATAVSTGALSSNLAVIGSEVVWLATDPFADGTSFAFVFSYGGKVWLGPRKTGLGAVSMNPDGTGAANHSFSFARDVGGGASHSNPSAAPYPSIGAQGCTINTPACGPNNENGRGLFFSQTLFGVEVLGVAGAHPTTRLEYVYFSSDTDPTIDFRFVDLSTGVGGATRGLSAAHAFNNRLYLGFPDSIGTRPYLLALVSPVPAPGLNAVIANQPAAGVDLLDLAAHQLPGLGQNGGNNAPTQLIDTLTDFNDRLYVANNGGIIRSTTNSPLGPGVAPADWSPTTPSAASFTARTSVTTPKVSELLPADKAFPAIVAYQGRLYAARNTTAGPQLWACTPGADTFCAPGEWALIA